MYEYDFLRTLQEQIKIYKDFPLPVVVCGNDLKVYWSNELAFSAYPQVTETLGLAKVLAEFDVADLLREAKENGNCTIREIFPFSGVNMSVTPLVAGDKLLGAVLIFMRMDNLIDPKGFYQSTRMTGALSDSIRDVVSEVFSILDTAALKSDLLNVGWMKAGFNAIAYNNYRILRIASNIAEYNKCQSGVMDLRLETLNLSDMLRELSGTANVLADSMGIPINVSVPDRDIYVNLDSEKFEIALYNVLHNALYYTRGGNEINITLKQNKQRDKVAVTVTDKGLGIPQRVLKDVTRPYFVYGHGSVSRSVGLGLTVAGLIVGSHDGALEISSKEGVGTAVKITLPTGGAPRGLSLAQHVESNRLRNRFSPTYIGLADAAISPYRPSN